MNIENATILVVDDEPELLEIFAVWLGRSGCRVLTAPNGAEALKVLSVETVHSIISDIRMPIMDGITLVRTIAEMDRHIPSIIFVSGFGDIDPREAHALGVEAMLPKPLSRQHLLQALENSLRERGELWQTPLPQPPTQELKVEFESLASATATREFALGRGGFCILVPSPLRDAPVQFSIHFKADGVTISGQGSVRWYGQKDRHAGIELCYLQPDARAWVVESILATERRSFIPRC